MSNETSARVEGESGETCRCCMLPIHRAKGYETSAIDLAIWLHPNGKESCDGLGLWARAMPDLRPKTKSPISEPKVGESGLSDEERDQPPWVTAASQDDIFTERPRLDFWGWWRRDGNFYDPDTEDVPWFDKRKFLAERAFDAGVAQSTNYIADREIYPRQVSFANGRVVSIRWENEEAFLEVSLNEHLLVTGQTASVRKNQIQLTEAKPEPLPNTLQEGILQELIALTKGWTFSDINDATPTSQAVISVTAWDLAKRAEALLAAPKVVDPKEEQSWKEKYEMVHRTMQFMEKSYLDEHGHWGNCRFRLELESLKDGIIEAPKVEEQDGEQEPDVNDTSKDVRNGFICAEWKQLSEGPILDFTTGRRRQVVYRCDRPDGHKGDHADSIIAVNWKVESVAPPSLPKQIDEDFYCIECKGELEDGLCPACSNLSGPSGEGTAESPLRAPGTIREIAERVRCGQWTTLDLDALTEHILAKENHHVSETASRAAAPVALPTHRVVERIVEHALVGLHCSCGRTFVSGDEARARASFEAHLPEKEGK